MSTLFFGLIIADLVVLTMIGFLISRKKSKSSDVELNELKAELLAGLKDVRRMTLNLEKKQLELEKNAKLVKDMSVRLEAAKKQAEEEKKEVNEMRLLLSGDSGDNYSKAMKMIRLGIPDKDISKSLGILSGELELMNSLRNLRN